MTWINKMNARAGAAALALLSAVGSAHAATVTYTFTAVVDRVMELHANQGGYVGSAELEGHHVAVNDQLTGRISFDTSNPSFFFDYGRYSQSTLPSFSLEYTFKSGLNNYASSYAGSAQVRNTPELDSVSFDNNNYYGENVPELIGGAGLAFDDASGKYLDSTALPASIDTAFPGLVSRIGGSWSRRRDLSDLAFWGTLTSIQRVDVSPVPEPASALLMLAGLGALGVALRKRRA